MSKPFTVPTKPLAEMTKDELFEIAQERQIPGRYDMKKPELLAAVEEALTAPETEPAPALEGEQDGTEPFEPLTDEAQDELNGDGEEEGDAEGDEASETPTNPDNPKPSRPPEDTAEAAAARAELEAELVKDGAAREARERQEEEARQLEAAQQRRVADAARIAAEEKAKADRAAAHAAGQLTDDDRRDLMHADADALEDLLEDPAVPAFVQEGIRNELERRKRQARLASAQKLMQSPNEQFKITGGPAGMRYVTPTGYVTTMPLGNIVTPLAYDLRHVAEQGFTWEAIKGVELSQDQLGNQVSKAK